MTVKCPAVPKFRQSRVVRPCGFGHRDQLRFARAAAGHGEHHYRLASQYGFFTLLGALDVTRPLGAIVLVGLGGEATLPMNSVVTKELKVCGAFRTGVEFGWAVDLISNRRVDMRPLLTASYPVEQAVEAFQFAADKSRSMKVQINFAGAQ